MKRTYRGQVFNVADAVKHTTRGLGNVIRVMNGGTKIRVMDFYGETYDCHASTLRHLFKDEVAE